MNGTEDWIQTSLKLNGTSEWKAVSIEPEMFLSNYKHRPQISFTIKETEKKESCHSPSHGGPDLFKSVQSNWEGFRPKNADFCKISVELGATRVTNGQQEATRGTKGQQEAAVVSDRWLAPTLEPTAIPPPPRRCATQIQRELVNFGNIHYTL